MKRFSIFATLLLCSTMFFSSCSKEEEKIRGCTDINAVNYNADAIEDDGTCEYDLTRDFVGIYTGVQTVDGTDYNVQIKVTKHSNTEVQIAPYTGTASSFGADLVSDENVIGLHISEQFFTGGSIRGDGSFAPDHPDIHGLYNVSTHEFGYSIVVMLNGVEHSEIFLGTK